MPNFGEHFFIATTFSQERIEEADMKTKIIVYWLVVMILSNLPDIDSIAGILWHGNWKYWHRQCTHSLLFAIVTGWLSFQIIKRVRWLPTIAIEHCMAVILSHTIADYVFTPWQIEFYWPLSIHLPTWHWHLLRMIQFGIRFQYWHVPLMGGVLVYFGYYTFQHYRRHEFGKNKSG